VALKHGSEAGGGAAEVLDVFAWVRQPEFPGITGPSGDGADGRYEGLVTALETLAETSASGAPAVSSAPAV
jgi:hypothetical protein